MSGYCDDCGNTICLCDDTPRSEIVGTNEFFQKYRIIDRIALEKLESELAKANAEAEAWKRHHAALDKVCEAYKEDIEKLKERLAECEKVVAFYASGDSVIENDIGKIDWQFAGREYKVDKHGKLARDYQSKYGAKDE